MPSTKQILTNSHELETFMQECDNRNYTNNNSLHALKFEWCMETGGSWWGSYNNNRLVAISGIHPFKDGYRALFRGAQIELKQLDGLSKYQKQNYGFNDHLPLQIEWANSPNIYITTSPYDDNDRSGKMSRIHRSAIVLEKQGVLTYVNEEEVFYVPQVIWKLNQERYYEIRT